MKKLKMTDEEIEKEYPGLPKIGDKFHNHENDTNHKKMNVVIDRYIIKENGKKSLKVIFKYPDEDGDYYTEFELTE